MADWAPNNSLEANGDAARIASKVVRSVVLMLACPSDS